MVNTDFAIISVRFASENYMRTIQSSKWSMPAKISSFGKCNEMIQLGNFILIFDQFLGGILGLLTGMSLLSIIELGFWALRVVAVCLVPKQKDRKQREVKNKQINNMKKTCLI